LEDEDAAASVYLVSAIQLQFVVLLDGRACQSRPPVAEEAPVAEESAAPEEVKAAEAD